MVTIDLSAPAPAPTDLLEALPRRVTLTLPELRLAALLAGGAPLPFDVADRVVSVAEPTDGLEGRLGATPGSTEDDAYARAMASLHDPADTLRRRGLVGPDGLDPHLAGAVGLLATPRLALDVDVVTGGVQVKAWHRQAEGAVATLATCDGVVFELAWFPTDRWSEELARVAVLPEDVALRESRVPAVVECPFPLLDGVGEALRSARADLLPVLADQHGGVVARTGGTGGQADDRVLDAVEAGQVLAAVHTEGHGRVRVLAAEVTEAGTTDVGIVSWVLLADGWHALRPHQDTEGAARLTVESVTADDLPLELAPVLAMLTTRGVASG